MNNLLQKCVDELKAEKPDLSYIRGIIETLIEANLPMKSLVSTTIKFPDAGVVIPPQPIDEVSVLEASTKAMIDRIPPPIETI